MSMEYIRKFYDVPAKRGMAVRFMGNRTGKIVGSAGAYLRIKFSGCKIAKNYHPSISQTWDPPTECNHQQRTARGPQSIP